VPGDLPLKVGINRDLTFLPPALNRYHRRINFDSVRFRVATVYKLHSEWLDK